MTPDNGPSVNERTTLDLTRTQAEVLLVAVGAIGDDLDDYGLSGPQKRSYRALAEKVGRAYRDTHRAR